MKIQSSGAALLDEVGGVVDDFWPASTSGADTRNSRPSGQADEGHGRERPRPSVDRRAARASASGRPSSAQAERRARATERPSREREARERARGPSVSRVTCDEVERGASATSTVCAALAEHEGRRGDAAGRRRDDERRRARAAARSRNAAPSPSSRCAPRNTLKNGTATASSAASASQPRPSPSSNVSERDERAEGEAERGHDAGSTGRARAGGCRAAGPPTSGPAGSRRTRTRSRWRAASRARAPPRAAERRGARVTRAQGEDQRERAQSVTSSRVMRVVGVHAGPAQRGGAHEVGPEVVAEGEARRRPGTCGGYAGGELVGQADVERGVEGHERVEEELAGRPSTRFHGYCVAARSATIADERAATAPRSGGPVGPAGGPAPSEPRGGDERRDERRGRARDAGDEAEPVGAGAERDPERHHERRLDRHAAEPLERDARQARIATRRRPGSAKRGQTIDDRDYVPAHARRSRGQAVNRRETVSSIGARVYSANACVTIAAC